MLRCGGETEASEGLSFNLFNLSKRLHCGLGTGRYFT